MLGGEDGMDEYEASLHRELRRQRRELAEELQRVRRSLGAVDPGTAEAVETAITQLEFTHRLWTSENGKGGK